MLQAGKPRHEQISDWLHEQIKQGHFEPNDRLPSERELCEQFSVSRITVRRALQTLENAGLIYRRQGLGSFVEDSRLQQGLAYLTDFTQDMEEAGFTPSAAIVHRADEKAPPDVAAFLQVTTEDTVHRIDRIRLADDLPVAFDRTWLPETYARLLDAHELADQTIFEILEEVYEISVVKGDCRIGATRADAQVATHLDLEKGGALLTMERVSYAGDGSCIFYQIRYYRADRVSFNLHLERDPDLPGVGDGSLPVREFESVLEGLNE